MTGRSKIFALALGAAAVLAAGCASPRTTSQAEGGAPLPFIENDFAQAAARARDAGLPLFVEVWAPW